MELAEMSLSRIQEQPASGASTLANRAERKILRFISVSPRSVKNNRVGSAWNYGLQVIQDVVVPVAQLWLPPSTFVKKIVHMQVLPNR